MFKGLIRRSRLFLRAYFGFSHREVNGFLWLLLLLFLLLLLPPLLSRWLSPSVPLPATDATQLDSLLALLKERDSVAPRTERLPRSERPIPMVNLFPFDPNTISKEQWERLGLKNWLAQRILNYRNKGGRFRKKEDLLKIYDFPPTLYKRLEPFIIIPQAQALAPKLSEETKPEAPAFPKKPPALTPFDLNTADTTQLKRIYGIGIGYANRIIRYRQSLGGFYEAQQVREVYGLPSETADELLKYAQVLSPISPLPINTASADEISRHPYLRGKGRVIVAYRNQHGPFHNAQDLLAIKILEPTQVEKISPYLTF